MTTDADRSVAMAALGWDASWEFAEVGLERQNEIEAVAKAIANERGAVRDQYRMCTAVLESFSQELDEKAWNESTPSESALIASGVRYAVRAMREVDQS